MKAAKKPAVATSSVSMKPGCESLCVCASIPRQRSHLQDKTKSPSRRCIPGGDNGTEQVDAHWTEVEASARHG